MQLKNEDDQEKIDFSQKTSKKQESDTSLKGEKNQQVNANQEKGKEVDSEDSQHQENSAIADNYFSQLIDLLTDINLLEKRLHQKDVQKFSFG